MIRLFAGLPLEAATAQRLEIMGAGIPGARWVAARNLHITLRFFGELDEGRAADLDDTLASIAVPGFAVELDGFGTFGGRKVHTLWAGVRGGDGLDRLQGKIESAAVRAGLSPEPRKFMPHITLARLDNAPMARIEQFVTRNSPFHAGPWQVSAFTLFRSHLSRNGAEYEALAEYPLGG